VGCAIIGLIQLWRERYLTTIIMAVIAFAVAGLSGFTADIWYSWLGFSGGDGQVFIGYYLIGSLALAAAAVTVLAALVVLVLRPRTRGGQT
jgi:hypothetical protein